MFNISPRKALFLVFLYMIILLIPDLLQLFLATNVLSISKKIYYEKIADSLISNFTICISFIVITFFLRKPLRKLVSQKIENNTKIIIFSILVFIQ